MTEANLSNERRSELRAVMAALKRAGALARQTAIDTNTGIVIVRDGEIVHISAAELLEERRLSGQGRFDWTDEGAQKAYPRRRLGGI